jgi:hypothetical protein
VEFAMAWPKKPQPVTASGSGAALIGIELNGTCARAVHGPGQLLPSSLSLDGSHGELPMILSLEGRHPQLGRIAAGLSRLAPHLTCTGFLAALGEPRIWSIGRHRIDSAKALALVLQHMQPACTGTGGLVWTLPAYLTAAQVTLLPPLAEKARLPLLGSLRSPLAVALAAYPAAPWSGVALVVDADDHAFSAATVVADGDQLWIHAAQSWPNLSLGAWKSRLLDAVAERCIRQSRRDPRDSAPAEQSLYEQLETVLDNGDQGRMIELLIQTPHWYQNLLLRGEELVAICARQVRQVLEGVQALLETSAVRDGVRAVLMTRAAGRLPGLVAGLETYSRKPVSCSDIDPLGDFGESLLPESSGPSGITVLAADAAARAAHEIAVRIYRGELPRGHLDLAVPLPKSDPTAAASQKRNFRILSADP